MTIPPAAAPATIVVFFREHHGAFERVIGVARRQSCSIATLLLDRTEREGLMRLRLTFDGGNATRLVGQLERLADVVAVHHATPPVTASATMTDVALTPFRSQADGTTPVDSDQHSMIFTEE